MSNYNSILKFYGSQIDKYMFEITEHIPLHSSVETYERVKPKIQRNDPCSCGSGKKYKKCCL